MAGLYEIWRDPTRDEDDPHAVRCGPAPCSPPPPRTRWATSTTGCRCWSSRSGTRAWLDPATRRRRRPARAAGAGRSRPARGLPRVHRGEQRPQQRPRAARPPRPEEPAVVSGEHAGAHPARRRPPVAGPVEAPDRDAAARARRRWRRRRPRPRGARGGAAPARHLRGAGRAAVAGRRQEGRAPAAGPRRVLRGGREHAAGAHPAGRRAAAAPVPAPRRGRLASSGASGYLALAFPLHPPGRPENSRLDELEAVTLPTLVVQGERDAFGTPEEFPPDRELTVVPGADHGFRVPRAWARHRGGGDGDRGRGGAGVRGARRRRCPVGRRVIPAGGPARDPWGESNPGRWC